MTQLKPMAEKRTEFVQEIRVLKQNLSIHVIHSFSFTMLLTSSEVMLILKKTSGGVVHLDDTRKHLLRFGRQNNSG